MCKLLLNLCDVMYCILLCIACPIFKVHNMCQVYTRQRHLSNFHNHYNMNNTLQVTMPKARFTADIMCILQRTKFTAYAKNIHSVCTTMQNNHILESRRDLQLTKCSCNCTIHYYCSPHREIKSQRLSV